MRHCPRTVYCKLQTIVRGLYRASWMVPFSLIHRSLFQALRCLVVVSLNSANNWHIGQQIIQCSWYLLRMTWVERIVVVWIINEGRQTGMFIVWIHGRYRVHGLYTACIRSVQSCYTVPTTLIQRADKTQRKLHTLHTCTKQLTNILVKD